MFTLTRCWFCRGTYPVTGDWSVVVNGVTVPVHRGCKQNADDFLRTMTADVGEKPEHPRDAELDPPNRDNPIQLWDEK